MSHFLCLISCNVEGECCKRPPHMDTRNRRRAFSRERTSMTVSLFLRGSTLNSRAAASLVFSATHLTAFNLKIKSYDAFLFNITNTRTHYMQVFKPTLCWHPLRRYAPGNYSRTGVYYCTDLVTPGIKTRPGV